MDEVTRGGQRRRSALVRDERTLGLRRVAVPTALGRIVVRTGRRSGDTATILLHGAAGSWTTWTPFIKASDRGAHPLSDVVAIDLPGWGESGTLAAGATVTDMSDAVADVALALGYRRWRVIGHSLGGVIALDLAARRIEETVAVGLISGSGASVIDAIRRPVRGGIALPGFAGMLALMRILGKSGVAGTGFVRLVYRWGLLGRVASPLFFDRTRLDPSVVAALSTEVRPAAFAAAARAAAKYDVSTWSAVRCPVRSVRGERDVFVGDADAVDFAARLVDFSARPIVGAGHFAAIEQPSAVWEALRDVFIADPDRRLAAPSTAL